MLWARSFWITRSTSSRASSLLQGPWWACWPCGSRLAGDAIDPVILEHRSDIIASKLAPTGVVVGMLALWEPACRRCFSPGHSGASGRHHREQARSCRGRGGYAAFVGAGLPAMLWARSFWSIGATSSRASSLLRGSWWACWLCGSRLAGDAVAPVILEHPVDIIASKLAPTGGVVGMLALWEPACRRCCSPGHSGASGRHHREQARSHRGRGGHAGFVGAGLPAML